jgi:uncharacterized protein (TIGR03118 family)
MKRPHRSIYFAAALVALAVPALNAGFVQTNLTSDIPGLAANLDPNLKNPWGMSFSPTSPFWSSNQVTGTSTLYTGAGTPLSLVVTVPPTTGIPAGPTGQVFNSTTAFIDGNGTKASFIFDTLSGTLDAWNGMDGTTAEIMHAAPGASYTGLALDPATDRLYAANFATGQIDTYNSSFAPTATTGGFIDPNAMAGYSPYNVQTVNGLLYVEYDQVNPTTHRPQFGAGLGYVDVFDTNGNLLKRLASGGVLDAPWGIAMAPAGFGGFGGDLLVGNFGNGEINAFNPTTGAFAGTITDASGNPIVNSGLWALEFRTGGPGVNPNALYFTAGINGEADGLFGSITTPEPGTLAAGLIGLALLLRRRRIA